MKSILEILKLSTDYLKQKGVGSPRLQAEEILSDVLEIKRLQLYMEFDRPLTECELDACRKRLLRRAQGEPIQYIRGEVEFLDCVIKVTRDVLIPRQETEILADTISKELAKEELAGKTLWDVCCGSGCIGIGLKKRFPELKVVLSDNSAQALKIAEENAKRNEVEVDLLQGDLLQPFGVQKAHFLVANPPYIAEEEFAGLDKEVRLYEPKQALVAGKSGLEFYERFVHELPKHLFPLAKVWFEIGYNQAKALYNLFKEGSWKNSRVGQDWAGRDRFFFLEIE